MKRLYGINEITSFDSVAYEKTIREINDDYPGDIQFVVCDTTQYKKYGELDFGEYSHALRQPIQILYFQKDTLLSYHANCFAKGGLTNIDWNVNNRFEHFIPKSAIKMDDIAIPITSLSAIFNLEPDESKINVFIFWTNYLGKISESTIQLVKNNIRDANKIDETSITVINTDLYFITAFERKNKRDTIRSKAL